MKKLLISVALAGLFAGAPAFAQEHHDEHGGGAPPAHPPQAAPAPAPAAHPQPARPAGPPPGAPHAMGHDDHRPGPTPGPAMAAPAQHPGFHGAPNGMAGPRPGPGPGMTGPGRPGPGGMAGPRPGGHPNFSSYHRNFNAPHRFHAPAYRRPQGWYAHRWSYGEVLPPIFWGRDYWINDFDDYGLMGPPPGAVWVRYGDDALLIDQYSGEVIQVEYGVFY